MQTILRLLIINKNANDSEQMVSTIKRAGFSLRPERADSLKDLEEKLNDHSPDIILHHTSNTEISIEQLRSLLNETGKNPYIIGTQAEGSLVPSEYLKQGGDDLILCGDTVHLSTIIARANQAIETNRKLRHSTVSLREAEKLNRILLESSRDAIAYVHEGMHTYANQSYLDLFGYTDMEDIEGMPLLDMISSNEQSTFKQFIRDYQKRMEKFLGSNDLITEEECLDVQLTDVNEKIFKAQMELSPASYEGEPVTQICIRNNQGDSKELEEQLQKMSQKDQLTGTFNRQHMLDLIPKVIQRAIESDGSANASLMLISIDRFADLQKQYGIGSVDKIIQGFAEAIEKVIHKKDVLCRFEDETFALVSNLWKKDDVKKLANVLLKSISALIIDVDNKSITLTASIGTTILDENAPDSDEILLRSSHALNDAQDQDGNKMIVFRLKKGEMSQKQLDDVWSERIRTALHEGRLKLLYQPIISLHEGEGERYELFLRMIDKEGKDVPPGEFLSSAERTGMVKGIDRWVLLNAFKRLAKLRKSHPQSIFFVQLTSGTLNDPKIVAWLIEKIKETGVPMEAMVFQFSEETITEYLTAATTFIQNMSKLRCKFCMTGYGSSLDPYKIADSLSVEYLKIDRGFMKDVVSNEETQEKVRDLANHAHTNDRVVIAPNVEDPNAMSLLWGIGTNYIQGNFLQEPSEKPDFDFSSM